MKKLFFPFELNVSRLLITASPSQLVTWAALAKPEKLCAWNSDGCAESTAVWLHAAALSSVTSAILVTTIFIFFLYSSLY